MILSKLLSAVSAMPIWSFNAAVALTVTAVQQDGSFDWMVPLC